MRFTSLRWVILCTSLSVVAACGGGGGEKDNSGAIRPEAGTDENPDGNDSPDGGGERDGGGQQGALDGSQSQGEDGSTGQGDGALACKTACEPDDCGEYVTDNCGGHLKCLAQCPAGQGCGVGGRADKCDFPPTMCTVKSAAEACAGKCGVVSDGCAGVINCAQAGQGVTCAADEVCGGTTGAQQQANQCVKIEVPVCVPETCATMFTKLSTGAPHRTLPMKCGTISDGCGGTVNCATEMGGGCASNEVCNFGDYSTDPKANSCSVPAPTCVRNPQATVCAGKCLTVLDNCGLPVDCGNSCGAGTSCNATNNTCETTPPTCTINAAQACAGKCGSVIQCGQAIQCTPANGGITCNGNAGEYCATWGGVENSCGKPQCTVTKTEEQVCAKVNGNDSCAQGVSDGCGGTINCKPCPVDQQCGLYQPDVCGTPVLTCTPIPVAQACAGKCGTVSDGCGTGGTYNCNASNGGLVCPSPGYCGSVNGQTNKCVAPPACVPKTCADFGHQCGKASDGCGHELDCWGGATSCPTGAVCMSNQATGAQTCVVGQPSCSGTLCSSLPTGCAAASPTRLKGTVRTPGRQVSGTWRNQLPVPNAIVYIPASPNTALPTIFEGVAAGNAASCGRCEDEKLVADGQSVLAAAVTNYKGEFTLEGRIPVGTAFKVVVKVGKWRRVIEVPASQVTSCQERTLALDYTRLPAHATDGLSGTHLPKIAISTGNVDEMECVFRGMGFAESEFTLPTQSGRLHMYRANGAQLVGGTVCTGTYTSQGQTRQCNANSNFGCVNNRTGCSWTVTNPDSLLFGDPTRLDDYDLVVWDCEGSESFHGAPAPANIEAYVNAGGRMFASHYSYVWIENNGTLDQSAQWEGSGSADNATGYISMPTGTTRRDRANPVKSPLFRNWLDDQGALTSTTTPQFPITDARDHAGTWVGTGTDEWVYRNTGSGSTTTARVQQLSFNTPYNASSANICGRVAYSGFHVANATSNNDELFPDICSNAELSAQEKILAFMLFDLATCVSTGDPPAPPACTPKTAADVCPTENSACGLLSDGCGGVVNCGGCSAGFYCDGITCKPQQCTPATCTSLGFNCGQHADGCGGIARNSQGVEGCGECTAGQLCGVGGPGLCGGTNCTPIPSSTACAGKNCGTVSNGCGGTYNCGTCPVGTPVCGGGGTPNVCGNGSCTPISKTTACQGKNCGAVGDGCGGSYDCGTCVAPDTCGGGGKANECGHPTCTPNANACNGKQCGWASDGCGGAVNCGACPNGGVCGGAGPNQCGSSCTPTTCINEGAQCGSISNKCGGVLNCGTCTTAGQVCGGGGKPNECGGNACTPRTCAQAGAQCGLVGDGCNGVLDCGVCTAPGQTCGGAGQANQCGTGTGGCNKLTCASQGVQCGAASDGCGGLLDCGGCAAGAYCSMNMCVALPPVLM